MPTTVPHGDVQTLDQLRSFYRGELSAVESYTVALMEDAVMPFAGTLRACQESHRRRVQSLGAAIRKLGGSVPNTSGVWGTLTEAIEGAAAAFGAGPAVAALSEGEDHGLRDYLADSRKLSPMMAGMLARDILPEQRNTQKLMYDLRQSLKH
jgi:hypothetical protein